MKGIRKILFATDFSPASNPALDHAITMAAENGAELVIAHVFEPPARPVVDGYLVPDVFDDFEAALRADAEKRLEPLVARAKKAGVAATPLVIRGIPYKAIATAARTSGADLIVLGTHGRTGVARLFLGSVASRVISTSPCPVLTVRAA